MLGYTGEVDTRPGSLPSPCQSLPGAARERWAEEGSKEKHVYPMEYRGHLLLNG